MSKLNSMDPINTAIPAHIWPRNTSFENGEIYIAGISAQDLAKEFGTPAFVIDEDDFRSRVQDFRKALDSTFGRDKSDLIYAAKAFLSVQIAKWLEQEGAGLDVCSGGELAVALAAKFPANRIELHGNNKSLSEIRTAIEIGVRVIVADSLHELERIEEIASQLDKKQAILLRLTPGVEAHTHEFISTAHEDVKFGFSISSGAAAVATKKALESKHIEMRGFHCHIGSQIFDNNGFDIAAQRVIEFMAEMKAVHAIEFPDLDLGGGFGNRAGFEHRQREKIGCRRGVRHDFENLLGCLAGDAPPALPGGQAGGGQKHMRIVGIEFERMAHEFPGGFGTLNGLKDQRGLGEIDGLIGGIREDDLGGLDGWLLHATAATHKKNPVVVGSRKTPTRQGREHFQKRIGWRELAGDNHGGKR